MRGTWSVWRLTRTWVGRAVIGVMVCAAPLAGWSQAGEPAPRDLGPLANPEEFTRRGDATIASLCAMECHDENQVYTVRRPAREWALVIADMTRRGAKRSPGQRDTRTPVPDLVVWCCRGQHGDRRRPCGRDRHTGDGRRGHRQPPAAPWQVR